MSRQHPLYSLVGISAASFLLGVGCTRKASTHPVVPHAVLAPAAQQMREIPLPGVGVPPGELAPNAIRGRLDHLAYDPVTRRLFVAALEQGSLEVIDLDAGQRIRRIEGLKRPQGIAIVRGPSTASSHRGWVVVGCGGDGTARAFDAETLEPVATSEAGENADNVRFDGERTVYVGTGGNEGPGALAAFDARTLARTGTLPLPLRPESFQLSLRPGDSRVFANVPGGKTADTNGAIVVADRTSGSLLATWPLPGAARNFPMAYDQAGQRLFVACRKPAKLLVVDAGSGAILAQTPCVPDSDDVFFDAETGRVLVIGGGRRAADPSTPAAPTPGADAALDVFSVGAGNSLTRVASIPTAPHARTGLFVPSRRAVYVVAPPHADQDARVIEVSLPR